MSTIPLLLLLRRRRLCFLHPYKRKESAAAQRQLEIQSIQKYYTYSSNHDIVDNNELAVKSDGNADVNEEFLNNITIVSGGNVNCIAVRDQKKVVHSIAGVSEISGEEYEATDVAVVSDNSTVTHLAQISGHSNLIKKDVVGHTDVSYSSGIGDDIYDALPTIGVNVRKVNCGLGKSVHDMGEISKTFQLSLF